MPGLPCRSHPTRFAARLCVLLIISCCGGGDLRGHAEPSGDGRTYLVVDDDNGGQCGPLLVDGKRWRQALHASGPISPGPHTIACGGELEFSVDSGTTFHFDYWGP